MDSVVSAWHENDNFVAPQQPVPRKIARKRRRNDESSDEEPAAPV